jgi:hypothetical protein
LNELGYEKADLPDRPIEGMRLSSRNIDRKVRVTSRKHQKNTSLRAIPLKIFQAFRANGNSDPEILRIDLTPNLDK